MKTITTDNLDYKKIGLACGLELHQQLDTGKLFCNCPSKIIKDGTKPDCVVRRKLRAVSSEAGEIDLTASHEQKKDKTFIYQFYNSCNCLVELDCQPPLPPNQEAVKLAIIISKLTNSTLVQKSHIMRKQVIDGSNVSGFQRTMLVSTDGNLDFDFGKVRIDKILLEEDAARPVERKDNEAIYSLDRLGIPLIELVVWHDIHTPEDVKKVALFIGQLFRSTGKAKRGLGSIRQDINISIADGARVEIKGTQDLDMIPEIVKREIVRQLNLLQVKNELKSRGIMRFTLAEKDLTEIFSATSSNIVLSAIQQGRKMFGFSLPNCKGILGFEVQSGRRVGTEISSVLKAKTSLKGLFHLDELPNYGITEQEVLSVKKALNIGQEDSFILLACNSSEINFARVAIEERLNQLLQGIPKETRMVTPEGNTEYQRPLSGSARMYPETDLKPVEYTSGLINSAEKNIPLSIDQRMNLYTNSFKISRQLAEKMVLDNFAPLFEHLAKNTSINPTTLAVFLLEDLVRLQRDGKINLEDVFDSKLIDFFSDAELSGLPKQKMQDAFVYLISSNESLPSVKSKFCSAERKIDLDKLVLEAIEENKEKISQLGERAQGLLMGRVMAKANGQADGKQVSEAVSRILKDFLKKTGVEK